MQMDIHAQPFKLTPALEQYASRRVEHAVGMAPHAVREVMVRLESDGGEDKTCRVVAWLRRGGAVIAEASDGDLHRAIDAAAEKLRTLLERRVTRRRTLRRAHVPIRRLVWPAFGQEGRRLVWAD